MAATQSRTVHSKTHRVCPIHTKNIGPIGPISSTISSPWIESLPKGRSHMPCMIQRATVPGKWLPPNHVRCIPRPTGTVLSTQEILDPSVHYPVLYHHLESSPYIKACLICHAWFKELLYQENGCVPITYGTFQDPQGLSYPCKKYCTHRSIIQYYTITLNRVLTQRQVSYAMHDSKSYCTRKMAAPQSRTVHSKTHRVCPNHTRNIGPIGPPWIESLTKGRCQMPCMIQRAIVSGKLLRPNHVQYISKNHRVCPIHTRNIGPIGPLCSTRPPWMKPLPNGEVWYAMNDSKLLYQDIGTGEEWEGEGWRRWRMKGKGSGRGWKREIINPPQPLAPLPFRGGGW